MNHQDNYGVPKLIYLLIGMLLLGTLYCLARFAKALFS